jgi:hypothetical protein
VLDVVRDPGLQTDDGHQARVRARDHLEVEAVQQNAEALTAVLRIERQADEPGRAELLIGLRDVRGHDHGSVLEPRLLVPVIASIGVDVLADLADGAQDHLEGGDLVGHAAHPAAQPKVAFPVEPMIENRPCPDGKFHIVHLLGAGLTVPPMTRHRGPAPRRGTPHQASPRQLRGPAVTVLISPIASEERRRPQRSRNPC